MAFVHHTYLLLIVPCGLRLWPEPVCDGPIGQPLSRWSSALRELRRDGGRKAREAWEALRGHVCGAVRLGMRRLIVAHSDEQGSADRRVPAGWFGCTPAMGDEYFLRRVRLACHTTVGFTGDRGRSRRYNLCKGRDIGSSKEAFYGK